MAYDGGMNVTDPDFDPAIQAARTTAIQALAAKQVAAGPTPAVAPSGADNVMLWDAETGAPFFAPASSVGGGGGTPYSPTILTAVQWAAVAIDAPPYAGNPVLGGLWAYADGPGADPRTGATISAIPGSGVSLLSLVDSVFQPGVLFGVGTTPTVGDRVLVVNPDITTFGSGVYTITSLGTAPDWDWVLTRASDLDTLAAEGLSYVVPIEGTDWFATGPHGVESAAPTLLAEGQGYPFAITNGASSALGGYSAAIPSNQDYLNGTAIGTRALAGVDGSIAIGTRASAFGFNMISIGTDSYGYARDAIAIGRGAVGGQRDTISIGQGAVAQEEDTVVIGSGLDQVYIVNRIPDVQTADFTLPRAFAGLFVRCNKATALTVTLSTINGFQIGAEVRLAQAGAGVVSLTSPFGFPLVGKTATTGVGDVLTVVRTADQWWSY